MVVEPRRERPEDYVELIRERQSKIGVFVREVTFTAKHISRIPGQVFLVDMGCWLGLWTEELLGLCPPLAGMWLFDASTSFVKVSHEYLARNNANFTALTIVIDDTPVKLNAQLGNTLFYTSTKRKASPEVITLDNGPSITPKDFSDIVLSLPRPLFVKVDINCWEADVAQILLQRQVPVEGFQIKVDSNHTLSEISKYIAWLDFPEFTTPLLAGQYGTLISSKIGTTMISRSKKTGEMGKIEHMSKTQKIEIWNTEAYEIC